MRQLFLIFAGGVLSFSLYGQNVIGNQVKIGINFHDKGELKKKKSRGLWWEFYVPFFLELAKSDHIYTYSYYISQDSIEIYQKWIETHGEKLNQFINWLKGYQEDLGRTV